LLHQILEQFPEICIDVTLSKIKGMSNYEGVHLGPCILQRTAHEYEMTSMDGVTMF